MIKSHSSLLLQQIKAAHFTNWLQRNRNTCFAMKSPACLSRHKTHRAWQKQLPHHISLYVAQKKYLSFGFQNNLCLHNIKIQNLKDQFFTGESFNSDLLHSELWELAHDKFRSSIKATFHCWNTLLPLTRIPWGTACLWISAGRRLCPESQLSWWSDEESGRKWVWSNQTFGSVVRIICNTVSMQDAFLVCTFWTV